MSHALKTDIADSTNTKLQNLRKRAEVIRKIRHFFEEKDILEVETPLLSSTTATDPHIHSIKAGNYFLQTSPEFAMKRLLASAIGPIFQICKAFRDDEVGRLHNPEFTMLEWYRPGFDHHDLMDEMDSFLRTILNLPKATRVSYQKIFQEHLNIDPLTADMNELKNCAHKNNLIDIDIDDKDTWLDLLFSHCIQPHLGNINPTFIFDYPASQAALAKIRDDSLAVAERFEVFIQGLEIANGYHELTDHDEQEHRFLADNQKRKLMGLKELPVDYKLISALESGMPNCAGVAVGIDRLVMIACEANSLSDIMSFTTQDMR